MEAQRLIFITGGARSGKSTFAESYATAYAKANGGKLLYIATSMPGDDEMKERIALHQLQRQQSGFDWKTVEHPFGLAKAASVIQQDDIVLLDCLTVLLTNELFQGEVAENNWEQTDYQNKIMQTILVGIDAIKSQAKMLLVVSNEVLQESIIDSSLVQTYSKLLGILHQQIVQKSSEAYLVETGVPILMKEGAVQ